MQSVQNSVLRYDRQSGLLSIMSRVAIAYVNPLARAAMTSRSGLDLRRS